MLDQDESKEDSGIFRSEFGGVHCGVWAEYRQKQGSLENTVIVAQKILRLGNLRHAVSYIRLLLALLLCATVSSYVSHQKR